MPRTDTVRCLLTPGSTVILWMAVRFSWWGPYVWGSPFSFLCSPWPGRVTELVTNEWELSNCRLWHGAPGQCWVMRNAHSRLTGDSGWQQPLTYFTSFLPGDQAQAEQVSRWQAGSWSLPARPGGVSLHGATSSRDWSLLVTLMVIRGLRCGHWCLRWRPEQGLCLGLARGGGVLLTSDCWNNSGNIPTACCPVWPNEKYGPSSNTSNMKPLSTRVDYLCVICFWWLEGQ